MTILRVVDEEKQEAEAVFSGMGVDFTMGYDTNTMKWEYRFNEFNSDVDVDRVEERLELYDVKYERIG